MADSVKLAAIVMSPGHRVISRQALTIQLGAEREQELSNPTIRLDKMGGK
jgi:hypothetical protein